MKTMSRVLIAALLAMGAALSAASPSAAEVKIRLPVDYALEGNPLGVTLNEFKRVLEEKSKGEIVVDIYPQGNLYKGADAVQAVLRGDVEMTAVVSPHWLGISPKLAIFELPYAFPTRESIYQAVENKEFIANAFDEVEAKGGHLVDIFVYDYALLGNSAKPIVTKDDFAGVKLRAIGKMNGRFLELMGATTVPVNITEVSLAIERGIIEGMSTAPDFWVSYKWSEAINYATDANFQIFYYPWTANKAWWEGLTEEQRTLIETSMQEVFDAQRSYVEAERAKSMAALKEQGVEIHEQTPEEAAAWRAVADPIWAEAEQTYGEALIDSLRSAADTSAQ